MTYITFILNIAQLQSVNEMYSVLARYSVCLSLTSLMMHTLVVIAFALFQAKFLDFLDHCTPCFPIKTVGRFLITLVPQLI